MQQAKVRNQLFTNLKDIGLQDQLKKHLRIQLCEKLKAKDLIKKNYTHQNKLYNRIMASLISQQLKLTDCGYANSIYIAQSGYDDKVLQRQQLIQIININPNHLQPSQSILSNLIKTKYPFNGATFKHISIQTNPQQVGYTLEQRLSKIDQCYRNNMVNQKQVDTLSSNKEKLKQYQEQIKRNYERDIERFKQFEAHSIKVKISQQWRQKYEQYSKMIQNDFRGKLQNLRKKQRLFEEEMIGRQKNLNEKGLNLQKTLRQKIQLLDMKNMTVQQHLKNLQSQKKRMKEDSENKHRQLKIKIREYDDLLLNVEKKIQYQVNVKKLSIQQEYQDKQVQFLERKKFIDEEYGKLMGIKDTTDIIKQQNKRLFDQNTRLRKDLTTIQQQLRISVSQNGSKGDRIQHLKQQIVQIKQNNNKYKQRQVEGDKKRKHIQKQIVNLRKQLQQLRDYKQEHENKQDSSQQNKRNKNNIEGKKSNLDIKLEQLKQQRKKQIQKLKMDL